MLFLSYIQIWLYLLNELTDKRLKDRKKVEFMWRHNQPQQHLSFCIPEEYSPGYCSILNMIVIKDAKRPRSAPSELKAIPTL